LLPAYHFMPTNYGQRCQLVTPGALGTGVTPAGDE
jgi:hypothetical protein